MDSWLKGHYTEIEAAAVRIGAHVRHTPALPSELRGGVVLKAESLQRSGSFKVRGAFNALLRMRTERPDVNAVLAVSSGNHAQAVALAACEVGLGAAVVMAEDSSLLKVAATRALGAEVISDGVTVANREERARELARERGLELIHPFEHWDVVHGQGTATRELLADRPDVSLIAVPVGGGGLISGTAIAAASHRIRVIGVEPAVADDAARSLRAGRVVTLDTAPTTIADGTRSLHIGDVAAEVIIERGLVDDIVTVTEEEIETAVVLAAAQLHLVLEPSGALPLAAFLAGRLPRKAGGGPPALLLSGGNVEPSLLSRLLSEP